MRSLPAILLLLLTACDDDCPVATEPTPPETGSCHTGDEAPEILACTALTEDITLVNDPNRPVDYRIECEAPVSGELTIEPGVVIEFAAQAALEVGENGRIVSNGGPGDCERIVLQGETDAPGSWLGVLLDGAEAQPTELRYTDVLGAGGGPINSNGDLGAIILWADAHLVLQDVSLADSAAFGLNASYAGATLELSGVNVFTGNTAPMWVEPNLASALRSEDIHTGNDLDAVLVQEGELTGDHVWSPLDVPYRLTSDTEIFYEVVVPEAASLRIESGTEVTFEPQMGFEVLGDFEVAGSASDPVRMTGTQAGPGTWKGIFFEDPDSGPRLHVIDHAVIDGAGGGAFNSNGDLGAVVVWAETQATVTQTAFANLGSPCAVNAPYLDDDIDVTGSSTDGSTLLCDDD